MVPRLEIQSDPSNLRFDRRQLSDEECDSRQRRFFGRFVAREAILDEEYWVRKFEVDIYVRRKEIY